MTWSDAMLLCATADIRAPKKITAAVDAAAAACQPITLERRRMELPELRKHGKKETKTRGSRRKRGKKLGRNNKGNKKEGDRQG